jgi:hypothetical protein
LQSLCRRKLRANFAIALEVVNFIYQGKGYSGYVLSSLIKEPFFHWLFINEPSLSRQLDDEGIGFQEINDSLICTSFGIAMDYPELVEIARTIIQKYLGRAT